MGLPNLALRDRFVRAYIAKLDAGETPTMPLHEASMRWARALPNGNDSKGFATQASIDLASACEREIVRMLNKRAYDAQYANVRYQCTRCKEAIQRPYQPIMRGDGLPYCRFCNGWLDTESRKVRIASKAER
jgi:hypothetical protein